MLLAFAAKIILESMDKTTNPCEDFYQYSCGNFPNSSFVSGTKKFTDMLGSVHAEAVEKMEGFKSVAKDPSPPNFLKQMKLMYDTCINSGKKRKVDDRSTIFLIRSRIVVFDEEQHLPYLRKLIVGAGLGKLIDPNEDEVSYEERAKRIHEVGFESDFIGSFKPSWHMKNTSSYMLWVSFDDK